MRSARWRKEINSLLLTRHLSLDVNKVPSYETAKSLKINRRRGFHLHLLLEHAIDSAFIVVFGTAEDAVELLQFLTHGCVVLPRLQQLRKCFFAAC